MRHIEDVQERPMPASCGAGEPPSQPREVRPAVRAQADELAVKRVRQLTICPLGLLAPELGREVVNEPAYSPTRRMLSRAGEPL